MSSFFKQIWEAPPWILLKFSAIPPFGFSVTTDPPFCSPKNYWFALKSSALSLPPLPPHQVTNNGRSRFSDIWCNQLERANGCNALLLLLLSPSSSLLLLLLLLLHLTSKKHAREFLVRIYTRIFENPVSKKSPHSTTWQLENNEKSFEGGSKTYIWRRAVS